MGQFHVEYKVKTADYDDLLLHLQRCNSKFIPNLDSRINIETYSKKIIEKAITFEAWDDLVLIGLVAAYFNSTETKAAYITSVSTIESYSGMGVASRLLDMCIEYGNLHKYFKIRLEVSEGNISAIRLYKKYGFSEVGNVNDTLSMEKYI